MTDLCEKCGLNHAVHEVLTNDKIGIVFACDSCLIDHFEGCTHWAHISWEDLDESDHYPTEYGEMEAGFS